MRLNLFPIQWILYSESNGFDVQTCFGILWAKNKKSERSETIGPDFVSSLVDDEFESKRCKRTNWRWKKPHWKYFQLNNTFKSFEALSSSHSVNFMHIYYLYSLFYRRQSANARKPPAWGFCFVCNLNSNPHYVQCINGRKCVRSNSNRPIEKFPVPISITRE